MRLRVPGSSANLGPGFDALGLALGWYLEAELDAASEIDERHPMIDAYRRAGGRGALAVRASLPMGRGLGFSGAARAAGVAAALVERDGPAALERNRPEVLAQAAHLEGHADNVAASVFGGLVVVAGGHHVRVELAVPASVVVWIPETTTSTAASRSRLPATVPFADAAFNVARAALLVAALATGDVGALREATADRLHQPTRLADAPGSAAAIEALVAAGGWCAWLSGSGPTVAGLCAPADAAAVAAALPAGGHARVVEIDRSGLTVLHD